LQKIILAAIFLVPATLAHAGPVDCLSILQPSGSNTMATLLGTNATGGCYHENKIFSDFVYAPGDVAADQVFATHQFNFGVQRFHGFVFEAAGGFITPFTIGYTVTICDSIAQGCLAPNPNVFIVAFKGQINSGLVPNESIFSGTITPGGPFAMAGISTGTEGSQVSTGLVKTATVEGTFNGSGDLASVELDFFQTTVPEPTTLALIGSGLLCIGFLRRR
jgi:hypothetical protein